MSEIYTGERILLPEFVRRRVTDDQAWVIEGVLFERCQLVGPAVLVSSDRDSGFRLDHPTFPGTSKP
jgi:hypothetical protein